MEEKKRPRVSKMIIILAVICALAVGASVFFYLLYSNSQSEAAKQQKIVEKVAKAIELPGETPTVVTVADKNKLSNKQLASKVDNGDMLLVFAQAKRLIVYRPSTEKVANMLSFESSSELPDNSEAGTTPPNSTPPSNKKN